MHSQGLYLGTSVKPEKRLFLGDRARSMHMHVIGRTGTGKTSYLEHMIRQDIKDGRGICVIDMLGNLYPRLVQFCAYYGLKDRVLLFDPSDEHYCPALNYFQQFSPSEDVGSTAEMVMGGIERVYKQNNEVRPLWETYAPLTFAPLIRAKLTLLEVAFFADPQNASFREGLLAESRDAALQRGWSAFDKHKRYDEKFRLIMSVYNRGMRFWPNETIRRIVGQPQSTINWADAMDSGKIVLCNLGQTPRFSGKMASLLGVVLVHQIVSAARNRRGTNPRSFTVYADEFGKVICDDFGDALDLLRQFGVSFVLANQRLAQLRQEMDNDNLYSAVMSNTRTKLVFPLYYDDAEIMAREIYALSIHADDIKYRGKRTLLIPHQERTTLRGWSSTSSSSDSEGSSDSVVIDVDRESRSESRSSTYSSASAEGEHESLMTVYERELEDETPVYRTVEEMVNHYKNQIIGQPFRHCKLKLPDRAPMSIVTPEIEPYYITPDHEAGFKASVYKQMGLLTAPMVDQLIDDRLRMYLGEEYGAQREKLDHHIEEDNSQSWEDLLR